MTAKLYAVAEGVPFVNGLAVPDDRVVHLTEAQAAFDLGLDRIAPIAPNPSPETKGGRRPAKTEAP